MGRIWFEDALTGTNLATLNTLDRDAFTARLGGVFEHSPWIALASYPSRPFPTVSALHAAMVAVVMNSEPDRQLALLREHPELARTGTLTPSSAAEQGAMGLDRLAADEAAAFDRLNRAYRAQFGFPFIIAVRGQPDRAAILTAMSARMQHSPELEMATALAEVAKIARFRLDDLIDAN